MVKSSIGLIDMGISSCTSHAAPARFQPPERLHESAAGRVEWVSETLEGYMWVTPKLAIFFKNMHIIGRSPVALQGIVAMTPMIQLELLSPP